MLWIVWRHSKVFASQILTVPSVEDVMKYLRSSIPIIAGAFFLRFLYCAAAACVMKVPLSILIKDSALALTASGILIVLLILIKIVSAKRDQGRF